jgi:DNA polymerase-3 subunit chi
VSRVDFYVLSQDVGDARLRVACRLAEKAYQQGKRVYLQTSSFAETQRLDDLLWTFSDGSFLPHEVAGDGDPSHERVMILIGERIAPATHRQLLVNLTDTLPAPVTDYERVAEIVDTDPERKRLSRERYKAYREQGCELESHNI